MIIDSKFIGSKYPSSFVLIVGVEVLILTRYAHRVMGFIHMEIGEIEYAGAHECWPITVNLFSATRNCYQVPLEEVG